MYNSANEEDDMVQMEEERLRMREHVMNEVSCHSNRADVWGYVQSCAVCAVWSLHVVHMSA